jgi:hypothetical protein
MSGEMIVNVNINIPRPLEAAHPGQPLGDPSAAPGNPNPKGRILCALNSSEQLVLVSGQAWIANLAWTDTQRTALDDVFFRFSIETLSGPGTVTVLVPHTTSHPVSQHQYFLGDLYDLTDASGGSLSADAELQYVELHPKNPLSLGGETAARTVPLRVGGTGTATTSAALHFDICWGTGGTSSVSRSLNILLP